MARAVGDREEEQEVENRESPVKHRAREQTQQEWEGYKDMCSFGEVSQ